MFLSRIIKAHKSEIFSSFRSFKDKNSWGYIHSLLRVYERSFHQQYQDHKIQHKIVLILKK